MRYKINQRLDLNQNIWLIHQSLLQTVYLGVLEYWSNGVLGYRTAF